MRIQVELRGPVATDILNQLARIADVLEKLSTDPDEVGDNQGVIDDLTARLKDANDKLAAATESNQ